MHILQNYVKNVMPDARAQSSLEYLHFAIFAYVFMECKAFQSFFELV